MPLPAALSARLKRRGILKDDGADEEVIAESYDDDSSQTKRARGGVVHDASGAPGCPNKWNPFHFCVEFCYDHWREGTPETRYNLELWHEICSLDSGYNYRRARMLKRYPLPRGWKEVYDPGLSRHYYWNCETDEVSWLSPTHPRAVIGDPAPKLAKALFEKLEYQKEMALAKQQAQQQPVTSRFGERRNRREERREQRERELEQRRRSPSGSGDSESDEDEERKRRPDLTEFDKLKRAKKRGIDPMDPAAYGDNVPVGKWSAGLETVVDAKTGADVTASGPLFQSRPYPAPGAILRKNAEAGKRS